MASKYQKYLPIGIAVAAGALVLFFTRKSGAQPLPPSPPGPEPGGGGGGGGGGGTGGKVDAPPFPYSTAEATQLERGLADGKIGIWEGQLVASGGDFDTAKDVQGIPDNRSPSSWYTDQVMWEMYPELPKTWPSEAKQGANWKPYVQSWSRTYEYLKSHAVMNRP